MKNTELLLKILQDKDSTISSVSKKMIIESLPQSTDNYSNGVVVVSDPETSMELFEQFLVNEDNVYEIQYVPKDFFSSHSIETGIKKLDVDNMGYFYEVLLDNNIVILDVIFF
jgi:hypothetical protein